MTEATVLPWPVAGPYVVAFSTRNGGLSEGSFASLNLGRRTGDRVERVDENRRRLCAAVGADYGRLTLGFQHHSATVNRARAGGRGTPGDGLWSEEPGVPMLVLAADCVPIAIARGSGGRPALAVVHAGRIGLLGGVVEAAVAAIGPSSAAAVIGPAIGPCCYEVGLEVSEPFRARFGPRIVRARKLDIWTAAERTLRDVGVAQVERSDLCTVCHPELFFSYRRDGSPRGVQGVIGYVA